MAFLTIAIPTYNRVEYLKELLPELIAQCKPYPEIEVLISNNCSTDGTAEYLATLSGIQVRTNPVNVGAAENFVRCVEAATGDWVWLFGDDDVLCTYGIDNVMDTLKVTPSSLLIVGIDMDAPVYFDSYTKYIQETPTYRLVNHTLITCNIFKKELFNCEVARKYWRDYGAMRAIMSSLKQRGTISFSHLPVITVRENRAPFNENTGPIRIMQLSYLRSLGLSYFWIASYIGTGMVLPTIVRRIRRLTS